MDDHDAKSHSQHLLLARPDAPRPGQRYRHFKGGEYEIVAVSLQEDTLEPLVTYRSLERGSYWTRTLANFLEGVQVLGRGFIPRFTRIEVSHG